MSSVFMKKRNRRVYVLTRVALVAGLITSFKLGAHHLGWEFVSINPLFSALVGSTIFLLSFLLNGVLSDYKESEKLPGEIASCLRLLAQATNTLMVNTTKEKAYGPLTAVGDLSQAVLNWVKSDSSTEKLLWVFDHTHDQFVPIYLLLGDSPLKARISTELAALLRTIHRIDVIRKTDFVTMVYWLANLATTLLCGGLIFSKGYPLVELILLLFVISFLLVFVLHLISDIDNPFGFSDLSSAEDVDLDVLEHTNQHIQELVNSYTILTHPDPVESRV